MKFCIGDSSTEELEIYIDDAEGLEADGEFVFNTLKEAKTHCLNLIDYDMEKLKEAKKRIKNTK